MEAVPLTLREANALVTQWHRHHKPSRGHKFSIGCAVDGHLVGAVLVGRPVGRGVNWRTTAEVNRLVTDGTPNACSFLYARAAAAAKAMGYQVIQTYILASEHGSSLKAAGWTQVAKVRGRAWIHTSGPRRRDQPETDKTRWERRL
jgi:hypothetical protein